MIARIRGLELALTIAILASAPAPAMSQVPTPSVDVTIGVAAPVAVFSLAQIASDQHLWPANVHVTWTTMSPTTIVSSLATGRIQLVLGAPPQYDVGAFNSNVPIQWIAQWQDPGDFQMIVRPGIATVADLKDKAIATTALGSSTALLAEVALRKAGLHPGEYKIIPMGDIGSAIAAVAGGTASALVSSASTVQPLLARIPGSKMAYDYYAEKIPWIGAGVIGYQPWVVKNETATIGILRALNKALILIHTNPALAGPSIAKFVNAQSQTAADLQLTYLEKRTPPTLRPVSVRTMQAIYAAARSASDGAGPSDQFAKSSIDNTYVEKMLKDAR